MRAALLLLLLLAAPVNALTRTEANAKPYAVVLEFIGGGNCSGTIIGRHEILTAGHCFAETPPAALVNGTPVEVVALHPAGDDVVRVQVRTTFPRWASLGDAPRQGDAVFVFGNPAGQRDVFRRGYVVDAGTALAIDMRVGQGDSGAAVFNERGQVVGIVTGYWVSPHFAGALAIAQRVAE